MDQERRKRVRSDNQGDIQHNKKIKLAMNNNNNNIDTFSTDFGSTCSYISQSDPNNDHDNNHRNHHEISNGVFDFPWLKEDGGVSRPEELKLEDSFEFMSQLEEYQSNELHTDVTTEAGIDISITGQCLVPNRPSHIDPTTDIDFLDENFGYGDELFTSSSLLEDYFGIETAEESLDCIWSGFA